MMNLHKLSAGNGYTYLTRQVAANDAADTGYANLGEYYSERGESPGVWLGHGLAGLDGGPRRGDVVREAQMVALYFLSVALGTAMAGQLAKLYKPETEALYFSLIGGVAVVIGILLALISPWVLRMMRGVR